MEYVKCLVLGPFYNYTEEKLSSKRMVCMFFHRMHEDIIAHSSLCLAKVFKIEAILIIRIFFITYKLEKLIEGQTFILKFDPQS